MRIPYFNILILTISVFCSSCNNVPCKREGNVSFIDKIDKILANGIEYGNDSLLFKKSNNWENLVLHICKVVDSIEDKSFVILQKTTYQPSKQEGVVFIISDNKYYYFHRNGKKCFVDEYKQQLIDLKNLLSPIFYSSSTADSLFEKVKAVGINNDTYYGLEILKYDHKNFNASKFYY